MKIVVLNEVVGESYRAAHENIPTPPGCLDGRLAKGPFRLLIAVVLIAIELRKAKPFSPSG